MARNAGIWRFCRLLGRIAWRPLRQPAARLALRMRDRHAKLESRWHARWQRWRR